MEGLCKKENGLLDMDNSVVLAGGQWDIKGLNGSVKKYNKIK